jgi:hypothetical protein
MTPLEFKEIVIPASLFSREYTTDFGARLINGTAPNFSVEELADPSEMFIVLPLHDPFMTMVFAREFLFGFLERNIEMRGQPFDIFLLEDDNWIRAAVARTVQAVIGGHVSLVAFKEVLPEVAKSVPEHLACQNISMSRPKRNHCKTDNLLQPPSK